MKTKKIFAASLLLSLLPWSFTAFAEYNPDKIITGEVTTLSQPIQPVNSKVYTIVINNQKLDLDNLNAYTKNQAIMVPLRAICEKLGYKVEWINESRSIQLTKSAQWITLKVDQDYYTFGKMAPIKLGVSAEIINSKAFVPLSIFKEILKIDAISNDLGFIEISNIEKEYIIEGTVKEINTIGKNPSILVEGTKFGFGCVQGVSELIYLNLDHNSILLNPLTDQILSVNDLKVGDSIRGVHDDIMLLSYPAQSYSRRVELLKDIAVKSGTISNVTISDNTRRIVIDDMKNGIILNISNDTKIVSKDGKNLNFESLKRGMSIDAFHSLIMTKSLPPISNAQKIIVKN